MLETLKKCELILMHPQDGINRSDIEKMIHIDFFEIGASGQRHDRQSSIETVMDRLAKKDKSKNKDWEIQDAECREIAPNIYLLNYTLIQHHERVTKRASIWKCNNEQWEMIYHQGTIAAI